VKTLLVLRRELLAYLRAPVFWVVGALFLLVEGWSFWLLVEILGRRQAPHGAVLRYFFGGTFLYWLFVLFIAAVLTMRLVAEERRTGTLEPLFTTPVEEWEVVLGKLLGAVGFWLLLWLPTLLYVVVLAAHAPPGTAPDPGPLAAGYLGTLLVGLSTLSLGLFCSALTANQVLAATLAFVTATLVLLAGALGDALFRGGALGAVLGHINLFRHMEDLGRGVVDSRAVVYHLSAAAFWLFAATRALGRVRGGRRGRALVELALCLFVVVGVNALSARHYVRGDWTRGHTFTLSDKARAVLGALDRPVEVVVFMVPSGQEANDLYDDVRELLERARRESDKLRVEYVDIDREPERLKQAGKRFGISPEDLMAGVLVVHRADDVNAPSKYITRDELAEWDWLRTEAGGAPRMTAWKGEQALIEALLTVKEGAAPLVCVTQGHGEPALDSYEDEGLADFADLLRRDHHRVVGVNLLEARLPESCDVVAVIGPAVPFGADDLAALEAVLARGGRMLALLGPTFDEKVTRFVPVGIEPLLARWGAEPKEALVTDVPHLRATPIAFAVDEGYADHPITNRLRGRRTLWSEARPISPRPSAGLSAVALISTSDKGWGETDLQLYQARAEVSFDKDRDLPGPVSIAVAAERGEGAGRGARLVAIGSSAIAGNRQLLGYDRDLLLSAMAWLERSEVKTALGPRTPEHLLLALDDGERRRLFWIVVVGLPLFVLLLGAGVAWIRRS
jgi:ABC-2 type transport system permease protein